MKKRFRKVFFNKQNTQNNFIDFFPPILSIDVYTFDCHTSLYGLQYCNFSITKATVPATSDA